MSERAHLLASELLAGEIEFRSSLFQSCMDSSELALMDPTLAVVFRDAHELEGGSRKDLRAWLKDFKEKNAGGKAVLSRDGLRHLANSVWRFNYEVCSHQKQRKYIHLQVYYMICASSGLVPESCRPAVHCGCLLPCDSLERLAGVSNKDENEFVMIWFLEGIRVRVLWCGVSSALVWCIPVSATPWFVCS